MDSSDVAVSTKQLREWKEKPNINPLTGYPIKSHSPWSSFFRKEWETMHELEKNVPITTQLPNTPGIFLNVTLNF